MAILKPHRITMPMDETGVRHLKCGEPVLLTGKIFTGRDRLHKHVNDGGKLPVSLRDGAIYHCGPVMVFKDDVWHARAAGPTTSSREEPYMAHFIKATGIRIIIGKGGMGAATRAACAAYGCAYLQTTGGAAQVLAARIASVVGGYFIDTFGMAEAMWELEVNELPAVVTIDATGQSYYERVEKESVRIFNKLCAGTAVQCTENKGEGQTG